MTGEPGEAVVRGCRRRAAGSRLKGSDRRGVRLAPAPAVWSTASTLLLLCLLARESLLTAGLTCPSAAPECCIARAEGQPLPRRSGVARHIPKQSPDAALDLRGGDCPSTECGSGRTVHECSHVSSNSVVWCVALGMLSSAGRSGRGVRVEQTGAECCSVDSAGGVGTRATVADWCGRLAPLYERPRIRLWRSLSL